MIAPVQIRKPQNWSDFEKLCKKLWGDIWCCSDTIQHGRSGQSQSGVDVYELPKDSFGELSEFQLELMELPIQSPLSIQQ